MGLGLDGGEIVSWSLETRIIAWVLGLTEVKCQLVYRDSYHRIGLGREEGGIVN